MKSYLRWKISVGLAATCLSLVLLRGAVIAQITPVPSSITLASTTRQNVSKTLQISTAEVVDSLQVLASDLETIGGSDQILAADIDLMLSSPALQPNEVATVVLSIESDQLKRSGEYTGNLLVRHDQFQQMVPFTLRIKDSVWRPLFVLIGGVLLGVGLSWYRANELPRDEVMVKVGQLRTQLRGDRELAQRAQRFRMQVEAFLVEVETALNARDWAAANGAIASAQLSWDRWRKSRENWIELLNYRGLLLAQVEQHRLERYPYGMAIQAQLDRFEWQLAASDDTPIQARDWLTNVQQQMMQYLEGKALVDLLYEQLHNLPDSEKLAWQTAWQLQERTLQNFNPENSDKFYAEFDLWCAAVKADIQAVIQIASSSVEESVSQINERSAIAAIPTSAVPPAPMMMLANPRGEQSAKRRLWMFNRLSQGAAIALLSLAGMAELYEGNPTFGSAPMGDYFVLLAWGFGTEVTRESVVRAVRDLSLPLKNNKKS